MRVEDLHHEELLELDPEGGVIRFAGQRALLVDAVAMGLLRQNLVDNFGLTAARAVAHPVRLCPRLADGGSHARGVRVGEQ